jgi:hypothetical protein
VTPDETARPLVQGRNGDRVDWIDALERVADHVHGTDDVVARLLKVFPGAEPIDDSHVPADAVVLDLSELKYELLRHDWPRDPITGQVVLGAAAGRTTFAETVARADDRLAELRALRRRAGSLLVKHLDRLAAGDPVEPIVADLIRDVDAFAARRKGDDAT